MMVPSTAAVATALATARRLLFATAGRFCLLFTAAFLLRFAAGRFAAATAAAMEQTTVAAVAAPAAVTAAATTTKASTAAAIAAAAAVVTEGVCLRLEPDQDDGHDGQSQDQLQYIALHQITSKHEKKIGTFNRLINCDGQPTRNGDRASNVSSKSLVRVLVD
jgi:hypothetical protein